MDTTGLGSKEMKMERATIQDWIKSQVLLSSSVQRDVKYRIYRENNKHYQDIRELDDTPIHTLELPDGMRLDRSSYEVLLRYVLMDVVAA